MVRKKKCTLILILLIPMLLCTCKKESENPVCGPKTYTFYGNKAVDAINQLSQKRQKIKADNDDGALWWLKTLKEAPAPVEGLFATTAKDYGEDSFHVEMRMVYQYNQHFEIDYLYPHATLSVTNPESGRQFNHDCHIRYRFYRIYTYQNRILQTVEEYYQYYYSKQNESKYDKMIDEKLYVSDYISDRLYFDLNPGIGVVEVVKDEAGSVIPYETLLPLCRWELFPIDIADRENVIEHVGWW